MTTTSSPQNSGDDTRTAGGKISRKNRIPPASKTPYARPSKSPAIDEEEAQNPNWVSNFMYPAKFIASSAGKILSFFGNYSESDFEDDSESDDDDVHKVKSGGFNEVFSQASKSDSKRKVDQLVMEETFSREEGEQLIRLIKSRIVDTKLNLDEGTPPAKKTAIMEARKWLQEKRSASKTKSEDELDLMAAQFTRKEKGSPADMAKSYMQNRPTWSSSSSKHVEFESPSTLGMPQFKEETPTSTLRSCELKRSSFAAESWNLLDEVRRVRTKATEDLLAATPLMKTSSSLFSPANNRDILENKEPIEGAGHAGSTHGRVDHVLDDAVANSFARHNQDGNDVESVEHQERPEAAVLTYDKDIEVNEVRSTTPDNGFVSSVQEQNAASEPRPLEENGNPMIDSSQGGHDVHVEHSNLLTEHNQIPTATDRALNRSPNRSSMQDEDVSRDFSQSTIDDSTVKAKDAQKERKSRGRLRKR